MKPGCARRERGAALLVLLAIISLGASWFLVSQLNAESGVAAALRKTRNAEVLNRAKQALIGYVAMEAAQSSEKDPGRLPCPEAPASFDNPTTEGTAAGNCSLPAVGRLPWRTLGLDKLADSAGEALWYVVADGWAKPNSTTNTIINSNCASSTSGLTCWSGQLTVDGAANDAVALIIATGPAITVAAATGCTAWNQVRPTSGTPDWRNYLECENATYPTPDATFVTTGPSNSFNDQVIRVTVADIMPAIEAAIAQRIEREITPLMQTIYAAPSWGLSGTERKYPFAATFADPSASAMQGTAATLQGLLPMANAETYPGSGILCTTGVSTPRCAPSFVTWTGASLSSTSTYNEACATTATQINCSFNYRVCIIPFFCGTTSSIPFTVSAAASNVGMAMRQLSSSTTGTANVSSMTPTAVLNADGSANVTISGTATVSSASGGLLLDVICGGLGGILGVLFDCNASTLSIPISVFADHTLLDTRASGASTSWFARNRWHELTYYALAAGYAPSGSAACTTGSTCLSVTNVTPSDAQRAILILAGRSINGSARPSATLGDYLEFGNATAAYERKTVSTGGPVPVAERFNDRIVVIDAN